MQVARRSWSGNALAGESIRAAMRTDARLTVTLPYDVNNSVIDDALSVFY